MVLALIVAAAVSFAAVHPASAASFRQVKTATKLSNAGSPTSVSATFDTATLAGNMLVAVVGANGNVAINLPSGWSQAVNQSGTVSQAIFYKTAIDNEPAVTATVASNPGSIGLHIYEYAGPVTFMDTNSNSGNSTTPSTNAVTAAVGDELIFAAFTSAAGSSYTDSSWNDAGEGFTERADFATGGSRKATYGGGDDLANTAGSKSVQVIVGTGAWLGQIARFRGDVTAPAAVTNLALSAPAANSMLVSWTAPGDDNNSGTATSYDLRYSTSPIASDADFNAATQVSGEPAPAVAGTPQSMTVSGLTSNTLYYFALKTSDEIPNVSGLSNVPSLSTLDVTAPSAITNLALSNATATSIDLTWTAPGDDAGVGTAASYDIRYSNAPISSDSDFNAATQVAGEPAPLIAGTVQTMTVGGLSPDRRYYFAMKTSDEVPNVSALSNNPSLLTLPLPDTTKPAAITDLALSNPTTNSITLTWTAPGDDGAVGTAALFDIHFSTSPITDLPSYYAGTDVVPAPPAPQLSGTVQTMTVTGLSANTTYYFAIRTYDEVPNISDLSNAPSLATAALPDTTAPSAVSDLALSAPTTNSITLTWTAPGDDGAVGTATSYNIRYATTPITNLATFNAATAATGIPAPQIAGTVQTMTVGSLAPNTRYYFAMKTSDEVPNVSGMSNVPNLLTLPLPDTTPPTAISDLALSNPTTTTIDLTWTATGDDGLVGTAAQTDIHVSTSPITSGNFGAAVDVTPSPPAPQISGTVQSMTVTGLSANTTYYFAIVSADEVPNHSLLSNTPSLATLAAPDATPPAAITDLALSNATTTSIDLTWTAPGDDGAIGTATSYDIRYSTAPINNGDFIFATPVVGEPVPALAGTVQTMTVGGLSAGTLYYFAIKTNDEVPNTSSLSNAPSLLTLTAPDATPPAAVANLAASGATTTSIVLTWTAPGDDGSVGTATSYDIRYSDEYNLTSDLRYNTAVQVVGEPAPAVAGTVQTMTVTGLTPNRHYYFAMKTSDEVPNVSALSNATGLTTLPLPDVTPPAAVTNLAASGATTTSIVLTWTAPGDDGAVGTASSYDIRYSDEYNLTSDLRYNAAAQVVGEPVPAVAGTVQTMTVTGLTPNRHYYFAMKTSDEVPNVSALSNATGLTTLPLPDTTAPAAITDLALSAPTHFSIVLTWTAPGDDGGVGTAAFYDIHYSTSPITSLAEFNATAHLSGTPVPAVAGTVQTMTATGLSANTLYYFAMRTADEVPNYSGLSNLPSLSTLVAPDATAPAAVTNLALTAAPPSTIRLTWTAPGDDGATGTATSYDIRYSTTPIISDADFGAASLVVGEPAPAIAGTVQTMDVNGLTTNLRYYFAMKTSDEVPNISALSNVPNVELAAAGPGRTITQHLTLSVRATPESLPAGGGEVTFTYKVANAGTTHVSGLAVRDDLGTGTCSPVKYVSGDLDNDSFLDPNGQEWTYSCTTLVTKTATHTAVVSSAVNQSQWLSNTSSVQVLVGEITTAPSLNLEAHAYPSMLHPGGGNFTFEFAVKNTGDTPIADLGFAGGYCSLSGLLKGDANKNGLLDPGETWKYGCDGTAAATTERRIVATGQAGAIEVTDSTTVMIMVGENMLHPNIHLDVFANPAHLPAGGGKTLLTYRVSNDGDAPLSDVVLHSGSSTCASPKLEGGDLNGDHVLGLKEVWTYTCIELLDETEADAPLVRAVANGRVATDDALFIVPVSAVAPPAVDPTIAGRYDPVVAANGTPDIDTDKGLSPTTSTPACMAGIPLKLADDHDPSTQADTTVYYCGRDGKRYTFLNRKAYLSWYPQFQNVIIVDRKTLESIPEGGTVTYKPGSRMLKTQADPKVYAVSRRGTLRWITTEALASALYGADWRLKVDDVPEVFFGKYVIGEPITSLGAGRQ